jgi:hypothetical protein
MRGHFGDEPPTDTCENCGYGCRPDHRGLCAECAAADDHVEVALDYDADEALGLGATTELPTAYAPTLPPPADATPLATTLTVLDAVRAYCADDRDGWVKLLAGMSPEAFARFDALCDVADGVTT